MKRASASASKAPVGDRSHPGPPKAGAGAGAVPAPTTDSTEPSARRRLAEPGLLVRAPRPRGGLRWRTPGGRCS